MRVLEQRSLEQWMQRTISSEMFVKPMTLCEESTSGTIEKSYFEQALHLVNRLIYGSYYSLEHTLQPDSWHLILPLLIRFSSASVKTIFLFMRIFLRNKSDRVYVCHEHLRHLE